MTFSAVSRVVVGGDKDSGSGNIMEGLLAMLLSERFSALSNDGNAQPRSEEADQIRSEIRKSMSAKKEITEKVTDKKE